MTTAKRSTWRRTWAVTFPCWAVAVLGACSDENSASTSGGPDAGADAAPSVSPGNLDDKGIGAAAAAYATFNKINRDSFPTAQHAGNAMVDVFATEVAVATYRSVDPSGKAPEKFAFPVGAMLVKEMKDPAGGAPILTVMYKKTAGYDPANGDWWYGRLNADGTPTNAAFVGKVDFCVGCHAGTAQWDRAWGVPKSNQQAK
jgi:hypothetical protein